MYKLKQLPEDFIVTEKIDIPIHKSGKYLYFRLRKKNENTIDAIKKIAIILNVTEKEIGFAGSKDKNAVTEQTCSMKYISREKLNRIDLPNIQIQFMGYGAVPISLGDHQGNYFEITIRNLDDEKIKRINFVENYFDEQRFSKQNVNIGRHLIKKEFKEAVELLDNDKIRLHLTAHKNDYIGALKKLPLRLLRLYINAHQSYIWNETLVRYLELKAKKKEVQKVIYSLGKLVFISNHKQFVNLEIPLLGFSNNIVDNELTKIIVEIMEQEKINPRDFIIKQIPELSLEGEMRKSFIEVKNLTISRKKKDELNAGKKKVKISFSLPKGSYATMVIKRMIEGKN